MYFFLSSCTKDETVDSDFSSTFEDVSFSYSNFETEVLNEINSVRSEHGLNQLDVINIISAEAFEHNNHMLSSDELCHHNFSDRKKDLKI